MENDPILIFMFHKWSKNITRWEQSKGNMSVNTLCYYYYYPFDVRYFGDSLLFHYPYSGLSVVRKGWHKNTASEAEKNNAWRKRGKVKGLFYIQEREKVKAKPYPNLGGIMDTPFTNEK